MHKGRIEIRLNRSLNSGKLEFRSEVGGLDMQCNVGNERKQKSFENFIV